MAVDKGKIEDKKNLSNTNQKPGGPGEKIGMGVGSVTTKGKLSTEKSKNDAKNTFVKNGGNKGGASTHSESV